MKEYELGREGEQQARIILSEMGFMVQSPDWLGRRDKEWICFEIKKKERFLAPPFDGHGLDIRQIKLRTELLNDTGIRTYLMIFEVPTNKIWGQFLDILESSESFLTQTGKIKIYPLKNYDELRT